MNAFDIRMKTGLFPEPPASYAACVQNALNMTGAQTKPKRRFSVAQIAIAAAAVAASLAVILLGAALHNGASDVRPGSSAGTNLQPTPPANSGVPLASEEPGWNGSTLVLAAKDPDGRYTDEDTERFGRIILSFLHECGESEPDELWILRICTVHDALPADDTAGYASNVLVLAQSKFGASDGPDLYCIQGRSDGEVLWGTQDGSLGPCRVLGTFYGQQRWVLFGTNATADGSLGHIRSCYLTGGEDGTDIEFSGLLTTEESRKPLENSKHFDRLGEYFLTVVAESDPEGVLNRSLLLVTEKSNYLFPIRDNVPELHVLTRADVELIRENNNNLRTHLDRSGETYVFNLTNVDADSSKAYADAVLDWLNRGGKEPEELWLCAAVRFAFPEQYPTDEAYLLCLYEFDGETGPELFLYKDGEILWQTAGYDPYFVNTVYDPVKKMNCAFGFSAAFDNGPLAMERGQLTLRGADVGTFADDSTRFYPERPLEALSGLLSGSKHKDAAREAFIHPYSKDFELVKCVFTTKDGREFSAPDGVKVLTVKSEPVF